MMLQRLVVPGRSQVYRQLSVLVLGSGVSYATTTTTLCEDKKGILDLPKDKQGNIEWNKFWDDIAMAAGQKVSGFRSF